MSISGGWRSRKLAILHFPFTTRERKKVRKMSLDISKLPDSIRGDIEEFCKENNRMEPRTVEEALEFYLLWNGIHGYEHQILTLVDTLRKEHGFDA